MSGREEVEDVELDQVDATSTAAWNDRGPLRRQSRRSAMPDRNIPRHAPCEVESRFPLGRPESSSTTSRHRRRIDVPAAMLDDDRLGETTIAAASFAVSCQNVCI